MMEKNLLPIYPSLLWISLLVTTTGTTSCSGPATDPTPHSSRIAWDYSSLQEIAPIGDYPRMRRLTEERIAVVYENGYGSTVIRYSDDEGQSWSEPDTLFHRFLSVFSCKYIEINYKTRNVTTKNGLSKAINCFIGQ